MAVIATTAVIAAGTVAVMHIAAATLHGYRGGYGYGGYGYHPYGWGGAAAVGAAAVGAAVASPHCWINSYGYRVCN